MYSYLGTKDFREVEKKMNDGDKEATLIRDAFVYQMSKNIGAMAAVLSGKVDAIIMTGGIAYDKAITQMISDRVSFIAPVKLYPGEDELLALAQGALRVMNGEEEAKAY